ncbi:aminotransferase class V-fold PLP-dependent enzyme [Algoriphagus namhaensis]|uniref:Aminotransferase class V-fold PLP-dependent enzyme n=1 Tax=Algoriphagus namhaensis TaxID=915353 RepID=A0ABV8AW13_9BACT
MKKRSFLKNLAVLGLGTGSFLQAKASPFSTLDHLDFSSNDLWQQIRASYRLKPDYVNLENGYYCFLPEETLEKYIAHIREVNYQASYYMRTVQWENKAKSVERLSKLVGVSPEELVLTRNTTESLDLVISGYPWKPGDEAVASNQDYGSMLSMFDLQAKRSGIKINRIDIPMHPENDEEVVNAYEKVITPKTKLLMVPHIVNITGHILPVKKIAQMAHSYGVEVMVDGAHAVGHFDFNISELDVDYYGSSLHKWLSVPLGCGMLYVKNNRIAKLEPLLAPFDLKLETIGYLNHIGTHPVATDLAVIDAIDFQDKIGTKRKEDRLRYLQRYWSDQVRNLPGIEVNTPADPARSCGIGNVGLTAMTPKEMAETLMKKYQIYTVGIDSVGVRGCRICPNLYTSEKDLDHFVFALKEMSGQV